MQQIPRSAYLIIRQGNRWSDVFRLEKGRSLVLGRASSNEIPVPDERASRRHAEVFFQEGEWWIRDLGSRNGTLLDGQRITDPQPLSPGSQFAVASCRGTFVHSLEEFAPPPIVAEEAEAAPGSRTQSDISPAITHRKSKASLLESRVLESPEGAKTPAGSRRPTAPSGSGEWSGETPRVALELLQLAFELAQQSTVAEACDLALERLMQSVGCRSGGVLRFENSESSPEKGKKGSDSLLLNVLAARETSGRAYHPVADTIVAALVRDPSAILARNVASDPQLLGDQNPAASHVFRTTSILAAPLRIEEKLFGLIHLYTRDDEPELTPDDLEVALAIADVLAVSLRNLMRQRSLEHKLQSTKVRVDQLEQQLGHGGWVGSSNAMRRVHEQVKRVAPTQATVLIRGESGTGKELVARSIHDSSPRATGPFIAINCAALTPTLLESELFGHEKGAFTGATERKLGKFELAHTGTLMLDELGEMNLEIQAKFLRVLEAKVFERVGSGKSIHVDVRVIAATNRDLEQAVQAGEFRSDLYFRLRVIELRLPPLRERAEDILPLAEHFLNQFRARSGHGPKGFSPVAQRAMREYQWPGNVRELRNAVERAYVLARGEFAEPDDLALSHLQIPGIDTSSGPDGTTVFRERSLEAVEREHIEATLKYTGGQKNRAAAILGIERSTLDRKLKRMGESAG